jgi:hypothetical protein
MDSDAPSVTQMIIPGTYDLRYSAGGVTDVGGSVDPTTPWNDYALLRSGVVFPATGTTQLAVDVPVVSLTGLLTFGGSQDSSNSGYFYLGAGADRMTLNQNFTSTYLFGVVPGVYDVTYQLQLSTPTPPPGALAPWNNGATLRQGVSIPGPGNPVTLNLDAPSTTVSMNVTVNGATNASAPPLMLVDPQENGLGIVEFGTQATHYSIPIMPGTYDLYTDGYGGAVVNQRGMARKGIVITPSTSTLALDLPAATVAGTVTVGGTGLGTSTDYGLIILAHDPYDYASVGSTDQASYSKPVLPGMYDVYYQVQRSQTLTKLSPRNTNAKIASQVTVGPTGTTTLNLDVPVATVKGNLTINGVATKNAGGGGFYLEGPDGDEAEIALTSVTSYSAPVVPGTYDLYYRAVNPGQVVTGASAAPRNGYAKLRSGIVVAPGGTTQLDIDIPMVTVTGALTIAGAPAMNEQESGGIWLQNDAGDFINLGSTSTGSYTVTMLPGQFDVYYQYASGGAVAPRNTNAKFRCFDVSP